MPRRKQKNQIAKKGYSASTMKPKAEERLINNVALYFKTVPDDMKMMSESKEQANKQRAIKTITNRKVKFGNKAHSPEEIAARKKNEA